MSGDIGSNPSQPVDFELPFTPEEVPPQVPSFVRELAPAAYALQRQPLELLDSGLSLGLILPAGVEIPDGNWTHLRRVVGSSGDTKVSCGSVFGSRLEEHTKMRAVGADGVTELDRTCSGIKLSEGTQATDEQLRTLAEITLDPAMQIIASFALSGSRSVPESLPDLQILAQDGPKLTLSCCVGNNVVVYRPLEELPLENGVVGRKFVEKIYTDVGGLAPCEDPAGRYTLLGTIAGQTSIKHTSAPMAA